LGPGGRIATPLNDGRGFTLNDDASDGIIETVTVSYAKPAVAGRDLVIDDWSRSVTIRDPASPATRAALGNLSAWVDEATIMNKFGGWNNVSSMPWYWDEACTSSWYDLASVATIEARVDDGTLPPELLPFFGQSKMHAALDTAGGSGAILLATERFHGGACAVIENPWRHDGAPARDWTAFARAGWDVVTTNDTANIDSIYMLGMVTLAGGGQKWLLFNDSASPDGITRARHDLQSTPLFSWAEILAFMSGTGALPAARLGAGDVIDRFILHVQFKNDTAIREGGRYVFALQSLWFEHAAAPAWIEATLANGTARQARLPSTLLDGPWPGTFTWTGAAGLRGNVTGLAILAGTGATLDVSFVSVERRNATTNQVVETLYSHVFSGLVNRLDTLACKLGAPGATLPSLAWIATGNVTQDVDAVHVAETGFDFNLDGTIDAFIQWIDTRGGSNATDGVDDVTRVDANANGIYEVELADAVTRTPWISPDRASAAMILAVTSTTRVDADEDGIYEEITTDWASITSRVVPRCMAVAWNGSGFVTADWSYAGQRWAFGYEEHHDWDGDGADDFTRQARDVFDDASWWGGRTYETKT
ncbi:MAG: hypothetical protein GYA24_16640, partial [Candidatus Lokiarchaeota archaeon]|nr:hypothetical protein [Candidatus Lokiarchaeota archaeon]